MTEQALLPAPVELEGAAKNNSRVVLLAAGAGVLALLVAAYFLFFTGGSSDVALNSAPSLPQHKVTKVVPKAAVKKPAAAVVPATFAGVHSKDPFKPLLSPPPPPPPPAAAPVDASAGGSTTPMQAVTLTGVSTSSVTVSVNGVSYKPSVGSQFATYFKLLRLQGTSCATFLYGDESFDLCKGSTTTKQ